MGSPNELLELLELEVPEANDWNDLPWNDDSGQCGFTATQQKEINLFRKQDRFTQAKKERYLAYQERLQELQDSFDYAEIHFESNIVNPFRLSIWENDIEETRRRAVPAYAFDKFLDLPNELQFMIWSKTIEVGDKQTHILMSMTAEYSGIGEHRKDVHNPPGSTSILRPYYCGYGPALSKGPDILLQVCPDACRAYSNVFSYMSCRMGHHGTVVDTHLYNTWSDEYYIGERVWTDFKVLIDMVIMQSTTRPMNELVARDVRHLQTIRHLTVDLNIFGGAPANIWRHFGRLATLTIAFYPYVRLEDGDRSTRMGLDLYEDRLDADCNLVFTKPRQNKKFVKRAEAILILALKSLKVVALEFPSWKVPRIEVVIKQSGNQELDRDAEHPDEENGNCGTDEDYLTNFDPSVLDKEVEEDDSAYLDQLPLRMAHPPLSIEQIKRWKQRFHPSRERTYLDTVFDDMLSSKESRQYRSTTYYADSEGGSDEERPFKTVDPGEHANY